MLENEICIRQDYWLVVMEHQGVVGFVMPRQEQLFQADIRKCQGFSIAG